MEQLTKIYFQNEMRIMQDENSRPHHMGFYYTQDFKSVKEVPNYRRKDGADK